MHMFPISLTSCTCTVRLDGGPSFMLLVSLPSLAGSLIEAPEVRDPDNLRKVRVLLILLDICRSVLLRQVVPLVLLTPFAMFSQLIRSGEGEQVSKM